MTNQHIKVMQLGKFYPPDIGGIEFVIAELARGLPAERILTTVVCCARNGTTRVEKDAHAMIYRSKILGVVKSTAISPDFISTYKTLRSKVDIIHVHHPDPLAFLALRLYPPNCPIIVHWHSDIIRQKTTRILFEPLQNWVLQKADSIVVTSETYRDESLSLRAYKDKLACIPIGISDPLSKYHHGMHEHSAMKLWYEEFAPNFVVLGVGRLTHQKGWHVLIKSLESLPTHVHVVVVGDGPMNNELKCLADSLGLSDRVHLAGACSQEQLQHFYSNADIFCLPAVSAESFGLVLLEAMAHSLPVITTVTTPSGSKWVNQDGVTGININPDDPVELSRALSMLVVDEVTRRKMGRNSRKRFETLFVSEKVIGKWVQLYEDVTAHTLGVNVKSR